MDQEEIEQAVKELRKDLNLIIEKLMSQAPEAQNIVGQIRAYKKILQGDSLFAEECVDVQD